MTTRWFSRCFSIRVPHPLWFHIHLNAHKAKQKGVIKTSEMFFFSFSLLFKALENVRITSSKAGRLSILKGEGVRNLDLKCQKAH